MDPVQERMVDCRVWLLARGTERVTSTPKNLDFFQQQRSAGSTYCIKPGSTKSNELKTKHWGSDKCDPFQNELL